MLFALAATLGTWFVTALGAATVFYFKKAGRKLLNAMLGFSAGVMTAASFFSLIQPSIERARALGGVPPFAVVTLGFAAGAMFIWASDRIISKARSRVEGRVTSAGGRQRVEMLVLAITLHNIPEGLAVGVAFGALANSPGDSSALLAAISVAVGIGLQNYPEGAAVALPMRREGVSRGKAFLWGQASGLVEPVAGVIGAMFVMNMSWLLPWALAFAAGAMILVVVHELIPECQEKRAEQPYLATMGIIAGFAVMMLLDVMLG